MSGVNFLEKLLDGVAMDWMELGAVVHMRAGQHISASNIMQEPSEDYVYPCFGGNGVRGFVDKNSHDGKHLLIGRQGALCGNVQRTSGKFYATEHAVVVTAKNCINIDWAFHLLTLMDLNQYASQSAQPGLTVGKIASLKIPIPCPDNPRKSLEIQGEIVRILDAMTAHIAVLAAELTARKKQYNHYRDQLLSFEEGEVEWRTLGTIADINTGQKPSEILERATCVDYINAGTSRSGYCAASNCGGDTVTTPSRGQGGIGYVGYQKEPFWLGPLCYKLQSIDKTILINKYLFYFLQSKNDLLLGLKKEGGVPAVNKSDLVKLEIPVPLLKEQQRVVSILDKFDALTNSLSEGLPHEIALRQKQYEHYRDLLLNFPKPAEIET
ncbi:Type I restriction enzyme specificity protein [Pseudomonas sp. IsoF]|uniref:restriction endonuclease subunit S n=1 Tax=Pseudomonas sp. IsoF TaxID=2821559 RepID=UPI00204EDF13|nr:restriction endonuclease subunit S [Pseudomonas sp. IsoF]UPL06688.1 Type I restriction enzyme specificity protein [Pseudomonas sp. IsoF]